MSKVDLEVYDFVHNQFWKSTPIISFKFLELNRFNDFVLFVSKINSTIPQPLESCSGIKNRVGGVNFKEKTHTMNFVPIVMKL